MPQKILKFTQGMLEALKIIILGFIIGPGLFLWATIVLFTLFGCCGEPDSSSSQASFQAQGVIIRAEKTNYGANIVIKLKTNELVTYHLSDDEEVCVSKPGVSVMVTHQHGHVSKIYKWFLETKEY